MRSPVVPLLAVIVLLVVGCHPAHADELDDALSCGIKAYADTQPPAGEWAKQLVNELKADADQNQIVRLSAVKYWMNQNQRQDGNPVRSERIGTFSHTVQTCLTPLPDQEVAAGILVSKAEAILTAMYPPPPVIDPASLIAHQERRERRALFRRRVDIAAQVVSDDFVDESPERQKEIFIAAVALLRDEIDPS